MPITPKKQNKKTPKYYSSISSSTVWEELKGATGIVSKCSPTFTKGETMMPWGWALQEAMWPLGKPGVDPFHKHWGRARKAPAETRAGTLDVGSPWLDRDQNFQECFGVFFQRRLGKPEKDSLKMLSEGRALS
jgi:hypothetical protein